MRFGIKKRDEHIGTEIDAFRKSISSLFDDFFSPEPTTLFEGNWHPALDVEEDDKHIYVKADIPGIDEKNLSVNIEKNTLTISGEKKEEKKTESSDKRQILLERSYGSFRRSIQLPANFNADSIKAEFKNGVLDIVIPKKQTEKPSKIKIEVQ